MDEGQRHYLLGNQYLLQDKLDLAMCEFKEVLALEPAHYQCLFDLGTAYQRQGHDELAIQAWVETIKLVPGFRQAHYNLALAYERIGLRAEAFVAMELCLKIVMTQQDPPGEIRILRELARMQAAQTGK